MTGEVIQLPDIDVSPVTLERDPCSESCDDDVSINA